MPWLHTFKTAYSKASKNKIKSVPWVRVGSIELQPKYWVTSGNGGWVRAEVICLFTAARSPLTVLPKVQGVLMWSSCTKKLNNHSMVWVLKYEIYQNKILYKNINTTSSTGHQNRKSKLNSAIYSHIFNKTTNFYYSLLKSDPNFKKVF